MGTCNSKSIIAHTASTLFREVLTLSVTDVPSRME